MHMSDQKSHEPYHADRLGAAAKEMGHHVWSRGVADGDT